MFGEKFIGGDPLGVAVVVSLVGEVDVFDIVAGPVKLVNASEVRILDVGRVLGPVLAVGDQQLRPRCGQRGYLRVIRLVGSAFASACSRLNLKKVPPIL